jgi:hypothetical protein
VSLRGSIRVASVDFFVLSRQKLIHLVDFKLNWGSIILLVLWLGGLSEGLGELE